MLLANVLYYWLVNAMSIVLLRKPCIVQRAMLISTPTATPENKCMANYKVSMWGFCILHFQSTIWNRSQYTISIHAPVKQGFCTCVCDPHIKAAEKNETMKIKTWIYQESLVTESERYYIMWAKVKDCTTSAEEQ